MERLQREALRLIARDRELDRRFRLMLTVPGIGKPVPCRSWGSSSSRPPQERPT